MTTLLKRKKINKLWDRGDKLYDTFLETLFKKKRVDIRVSTPRTNTLELFALLDKRGEKELLIGAMCAELVNDIRNEVFAENGELFEKITLRRKF